MAASLGGSCGTTCLAAEGPLVLYEFTSGGPAAINTAAGDLSLDLIVSKSDAIDAKHHALRLDGKTSAISKTSTKQLLDAIKRSNELTLEVWLTPDTMKQSGPARIVTFSTDTSNRNFTLGQDNDRYDVRLRTSNTDKNGLPSLASPPRSLTTKLTQVVFTRSAAGMTRLYINGKQVSQSKATGTFSNWSDTARLSLGDEVSGGRPWTGKLHRVAIYTRALSSADVRADFAGGIHQDAGHTASPKQIAELHFQQQIAPLLAKHCLECHDNASSSGDLVLDRKASVMSDAVVAGDSENSPLWISVQDDSMPHNRDPLSTDEKRLLRKWIDDGAAWNLDWIDPADYLHDSATADQYVRRLTAQEYVRSVRDAVDVDISDLAGDLLPPDVRADGFNNTAYNLTVDLGHVEAYNELAKQIVARMDVRDYAGRFWGQAKLTDKEMRGLIEKMGRWVLRGPLEHSEIDFYRGISTSVAASGGDYRDAVAATIQAMLQSPRFLYRIENQAADGRTAYVDDYQLACRISYTLWGAPPDKKLSDAASAGQLQDPKILHQQVTRMLQDDRAVERSKDFVTQWLNLNHLNALQPSADRFPDWRPELADDMRRETLAFFEHVVWDQKLPLANLLDAQVTFCSPQLAKHYGIQPVQPGFSRYDLSALPERGGLLTQGSLLSIGGDDASMVTRGLFVLNNLLRGVVNDPPPCVDTTPVPATAGVSARTIAESRIKNEACGGCHKRFEPLAFGLEKFDGLGSFQQQDEFQNPLRGDGNILVPGSAEPVDFADAAELMQLLASSDRVQETLVWKLAQFAVGRPLTADDSPVVRRIHRDSRSQGGTYQAIVSEIIFGPLVIPQR
ncbi:DUF1592 domain-containing protein [Stieleria sp. TO1_6]|uniref:DUF1592 domain-containing protein n=1 Tax=Stieleria tagensis TaxID=2956795 RepID=UPI00209AEDE8|nr:DUF1592 domain-containing protein [Stieleria tagensis]MCO8122449.1 DUF1592 domain-containing protein [Stieleria tagensis]